MHLPSVGNRKAIAVADAGMHYTPLVLALRLMPRSKYIRGVILLVCAPFTCYVYPVMKVTHVLVYPTCRFLICAGGSAPFLWVGGRGVVLLGMYVCRPAEII